MAKLRTSWLSEQAQLHWDEKQTLFGQVVPGRYGPEERNAGWFTSLLQGISVDGFGRAADGFYAVRDNIFDRDQETLTPEIYDEMIQDPILGKLDIEFQPGLTVRQFRNEIRRQKRNQYMETYSRSLGGQASRIGGGMLGGLVDLEILSTIWIGGPLATAAIRARKTSQAMKMALGSGAQISIAATPLNVLSQRATYGQEDLLETALTATTPFLFTPAAVGLGRALSPRTRQSVAEANKTEIPTPTPEPRDNYVPLNLREEFDGYPGGVERWLDDVAQNSENAFEYGRSIGMTEEALGELKRVTFVEAGQTPVGREEFLDLDALETFAAGSRVSPDQLSRLSRLGLRDVAQRARQAEEVSPALQTIDQRLAQTQIQERRAEILARYPELEDALRYRDFQRAGGEAAVTGASTRPREFGPEPIRGPSTTLRNQAEQLQRAIERGEPSDVPPEFRDIAESLINALKQPPRTRNEFFRDEVKLLDIIGRLARGERSAQKPFVQQVMRGLPEHAEGDYKAMKRNGIDGVRKRFIERQQRKESDLLRKLGAFEEARLGRRGRKTNEHRQAEKAVRDHQEYVAGLVRDVEQRATKAPRQVSVDDLADILTASRFKRATPGANENRHFGRARGQDEQLQRAPEGRELGAGEVSEARLDEIQRYLRDNGVDPDVIDNNFTAAARAVSECRIQ